MYNKGNFDIFLLLYCLTAYLIAKNVNLNRFGKPKCIWDPQLLPCLLLFSFNPYHD